MLRHIQRPLRVGRSGNVLRVDGVFLAPSFEMLLEQCGMVIGPFDPRHFFSFAQVIDPRHRDTSRACNGDGDAIEDPALSRQQEIDGQFVEQALDAVETMIDDSNLIGDGKGRSSGKL